MLFVFLVPLETVPELPAESCAEIRASEGEDASSGNYWFDSIKPGEIVLARCDMSKLGKSTFGALPQFNTSPLQINHFYKIRQIPRFYDVFHKISRNICDISAAFQLGLIKFLRSFT